MFPRSVLIGSLFGSSLALGVTPTLSLAQGRLVDEGTFIVTRPGAAAATESFKIVRLDTDLIQATGHESFGDEQITSSLKTDSLGTPIVYELMMGTRNARTMHIQAAFRGGRLSALSSDQHGNESMKEYPVASGHCLILDDGLLHLTYFVALSGRTGRLEIISPRLARRLPSTLTAHGMEPIQLAGRTVTATHYSLANATGTREFWVDGAGRLLRVESSGATAVREELPR
jgi:hypothetical protein